MTGIRDLLKTLLPARLKRRLRGLYNELFDGYCVRSYGQEGEDIILGKLFADCPRGFYVNVGAHHPKRYSNTYSFYARGWCGINIDAMPGSMRAFRRQRPRDINIEAAISDSERTLVYHAFEDAAFNGFSAEAAEQLASSGYRVSWTKPLTTRRLDSILAEHLPEGWGVNLLSVNAEGHDLQVLRSMDWRCYCPRVVVVEVVATVR